MTPSYQKISYVTVHVLFWTMLIFVFCPAPLGLGGFELSIFRVKDTFAFFLYGTFLNAIMIYTYAHLALPPYLKSNSVKYLVLVNGLYLGVFVLAESLMDYYYMKDVYLREGYDRPWSSFGSWVKTNTVLTGSLMMVANFYGFTYGWFESQRRQRELEQAKLWAELQALKHQVNPHFLFNVLNSLYGLAFKNDDEPTAEGIAKLSQLMRYMLYDSNAAQVPLQREVAYIEDYIALQRLRLPNQVEITFAVNGQVLGKQIAPMILIPFVENAFKHGISTIRPTHIHIGLNIEANHLHMNVMNPIHPGSKAQNGSTPGGIGLQNVKQRLNISYPKTHQLDIDATKGIYEVNLSINL